ncbi:MAG: RhuM family protein [Absicoccus sp.]|uniref:virulence RhuM family protein n=1 Tax=Absicoccus sp. TaxID=2718527 RepID=UPI002A750121|nr:RhuM family protein [Absicoccus sp.]MDY3036628.1 RhuM family protein [Absicoccus sp.]
MSNEIIQFVNGDLQIDVTVTPDKDTVWLNRNQIVTLFDRDIKTIGKHINNALKEELDSSTVAKFATVQKEGSREIKRDIEYYNLDMIISVGYRVKSKKGIVFRKWATSVLKDYMIKGYALNQKRLDVLNKTISIQSRMLASTLNIEEKEVFSVIEAYSHALTLLDDYDHGTIPKPKGPLRFIV